jgi:starvation-inducible DNA-binding protein
MTITKATDHINEATLTDVVAGLNQVVAESYGLMAQLHLAHWNVEGTDFLTLHEMFQSQYEDVFEAIDEVAERVRALGAYAEGGLKRLASMSTVQEGPTAAPARAKDFVSSILIAHETVVAAALDTRVKAAEAGDAETEDLMIGRIKTHQKAIWFLNSYLK